MRAVRIAGAVAALSLAGFPAAPVAAAVVPEPPGMPVLQQVQPGAGVPEPGIRPIALISVGTMLVGAGLTALLVRPAARTVPADEPRRRRAPGRGKRSSPRPRHGAGRRSPV